MKATNHAWDDFFYVFFGFTCTSEKQNLIGCQTGPCLSKNDLMLVILGALEALLQLPRGLTHPAEVMKRGLCSSSLCTSSLGSMVRISTNRGRTAMMYGGWCSERDERVGVVNQREPNYHKWAFMRERLTYVFSASPSNMGVVQFNTVVWIIIIDKRIRNLIFYCIGKLDYLFIS